MQGTRADRWRRIIQVALPFVVLILCIVLDQVSKAYIKNNFSLGEDKDVISGFFYFTYTINPGAAWSFLANVSWAQLFFKILTCVSLVLFGFLMFYAFKSNYKWLTYSVALIIGGTIGNFIDRLLFNGVTDFLGFTFGNYNFPIFNLADTFLVVGVIMAVIHFFFFDENGIFNSKTNKTKADVEDADKNVSNKDE